ncbi:hypothetical protein EAD89_04105 [Micromonospora sp. BL4]|uniref:hypothetical protein n=1 Tax=Micromonospora sp. BL4 TaxID=2478710 RepID=UPI000EF5E1EA|nr:hypothetical protein [Micromonospora sp. BL4]RLP94397.1 hypothetical protein EAD89_04105 [Micromonospora sp. BL4]
MFETWDVSRWSLIRQETIGADEKYWLADPNDRQAWLFKANNTHRNAAGEWSQREDFAEKVGGELASAMGIPCARIELARRDDESGCVSLNLCPEGWELQTGAVVLDGLLEDYEPGYMGNKARPGHSLENICQALDGYGPPPGAAVPAGFEAFDVFVGYVVFDAVVANRDRHDENWAVMRPPPDGSRATLAGSFDHARALGSTLREAKMSALLQGGVSNWCEKGTAWRFEHDPELTCPTLVQVASSALRMVAPAVREYWLESVADITEATVVGLTSRIPDMSVVVSTFIEQVVMTNRRRVLDGC